MLSTESFQKNDLGQKGVSAVRKKNDFKNIQLAQFVMDCSTERKMARQEMEYVVKLLTAVLLLYNGCKITRNMYKVPLYPLRPCSFTTFAVPSQKSLQHLLCKFHCNTYDPLPLVLPLFSFPLEIPASQNADPSLKFGNPLLWFLCLKALYNCRSGLTS